MILRDFTTRPLAAMMHVQVILVIQRNMFIGNGWLLNCQRQSGVACQAPTLILIRHKVRESNSQAAAFPSRRTDWTEEGSAKAPPATREQLFIACFGKVVRNPVNHPCRFSRQVGTWRCRAFNFQFCKRRIVCHLLKSVRLRKLVCPVLSVGSAAKFVYA